MAIELETAEIGLDLVGAEAVQQTLDALGVNVDEINAASAEPARDGIAGDTNHTSNNYATDQADESHDLRELVAEQRRTNDLLERLIELTEQQQHNTPTY